jgi:ribosomal protein L25 (general stress protein Ctc)
MNASVKSKIKTTEGRTMERRIKKFGELIAIIPINYNPPMTRCSLCVRRHDFSLMSRNKSGELVCNKCAQPARATIHAPTITVTPKQSRRNTSRLENFLGKRIGNLKRQW